MAKLGYEILSVLSEEVEIKVGCMDYAVEVARSLNKQEVDVIITRGGTASWSEIPGLKFPLSKWWSPVKSWLMRLTLSGHWLYRLWEYGSEH